MLQCWESAEVLSLRVPDPPVELTYVHTVAVGAADTINARDFAENFLLQCPTRSTNFPICVQYSPYGLFLQCLVLLATSLSAALLVNRTATRRRREKPTSAFTEVIKTDGILPTEERHGAPSATTSISTEFCSARSRAS